MTANGTADFGNSTAPPTGDPGIDLVSLALPFVAFAAVAGVFLVARRVQSRRKP